MAGFPVLGSSSWPFPGHSPACPHLFCIVETKIVCSIPVWPGNHWVEWDDWFISACDALVDAAQHPIGFCVISSQNSDDVTHPPWACCPPGPQAPSHRPQVTSACASLQDYLFPAARPYTCLCSIWFVLYSSSAFNWLCARAAEKVWVSPQSSPSTTDGAKWRLLSWPEAG